MAESRQRARPPRRRGEQASKPEESAAPQEGDFAQPAAPPLPVSSPEREEPRFRIFIVDSGWNSAARRVLLDNFSLIRDLQKEDPIYVLSRERSIEFMRRHGSRIGRDPIIAVHDMAALGKGGTGGFHGFRLSLGLLRTPAQALLGLQSFARFLVTHRRSADLEADIRANLRREGFAGALEIMMHHEARDIVSE